MNILYLPGLKGRTIEPNDEYIPSSGNQYFGFTTPDGAWCILRRDTSVTDTVANRYATSSNNASYQTYASAWGSKESLNYDYFHNVTL